ncbi:uncharacterized protein LOC131185818 [Ahaetulla prasina]|uniref:uncharacterized protein LOC131185818 n=1 Tax=Ahaetulla prasina TaxID=499056 RepID=UPI002648B2ED|nr:uncharacterized protein LOC131185818 [Ahaetulla prasina]XP_058014682.1 uncharacterized protein LOC131185818 [Ahaetulla prasina]XP_058014684.1 uncharacterized protein LOC131185818 [Ahaetulla prasina]XP_058014685.1 uncharacterized protein LOC131185818 [Ahaetulla prasina]XP_058014686.1 uncharacterized protein LOC131185818 [Ahaetulla prasina]XP_058014687.1 uncharacterized protein LOC131185818 [Ahaetulla prasina]XP_058014688.1 uncharacterized protein LOC131185818 [Ahaetulla prasina]XP_05801468
MTQQPSEMQQVAAALNKIGEEIAGLSERIDNMTLEMTLEMKKMKQEMNENFAKQTMEMTIIKDELEQIHIHEAKVDRQIGEIFYKNEQQDKRNTQITFKIADLASVFRIGYRRQNGSNRNVLVRFANLGDKLEVMAKVREMGDALKFEGKTIQVFPDISREERAWRFFLKPITKVLRDNGIKYNWRPPQQLKFFYKGRMRTITPDIDAILYLRELGLIKEEDLMEIKDQMLKMGGIHVETSTPEEEKGAIGGQDPKGLKRKEISPVLVEQKKSREDTAGEEADKSLGKYEAECGRELSLSFFLSDEFK